MGVTVERVLSDNGACYRSAIHAETCAELGMRRIFTRPYRPRTNGKAERFIQTLTYRDDTAPLAINRPRLGSPSWNNVLSNYTPA